MEKSLNYDDILLVPRYSELNSRSEADTSVEFLGRRFDLPIIASNMESVINEKLCKWFSENNLFYVMHRFNLNHYNFVCDAQNWKLVSISCGVNENNTEFENLKLISKDNLRVDVVNIDVAHGHHIKVKKRIQWLKDNLPNTKIIAGNVATGEACIDLVKWGADAIKTLIGSGSICTTKYQTGFGFPSFSCIQDCDQSLNFEKDYPLIADGGAKYLGDIPKAIRAGATMVMTGALFASCIDSAAQIKDGKKQYYGSTSFNAKKENKHIEGKLVEMPYEVTIAERIKEIKMALQSSISYSGGRNLNALKTVAYNIVN